MSRKPPIVVSAVIALGLAALAAGGEAQMPTVWPAESVKWGEGPVKGVQTAELWGSLLNGGPFGALIKFEAGLTNPLHHHTQTLKIVVISGTFVFTPEGGSETKLGAGSYLVQPAGAKHISGCAAGAECVFFMTADDKFDLIPEAAESGK